jgi:hypothetical protein
MRGHDHHGRAAAAGARRGRSDTAAPAIGARLSPPARHGATGGACGERRATIVGDAVSPRPLGAPAAAARPWWSWPRIAWIGGALAAAVVLALIVVGRGTTPQVAERHVRVKGGELGVSVVRERGGLVDLDAETFQTSDRLKLRITCTPAAVGVALHADVVVFQAGQGGASFPVPPAQLACGNDVTLPGAFRVTEAAPATLCLAIGDQPADRDAIARRGPHGRDLACVTIRPD